MQKRVDSEPSRIEWETRKGPEPFITCKVRISRHRFEIPKYQKTGSSFKVSQDLVSAQGFYTTQREEDVHMRFNFRHPPKEAPQELEGDLLSDFVCTIKKDEIDRIDGTECGEWREMGTYARANRPENSRKNSSQRDSSRHEQMG